MENNYKIKDLFPIPLYIGKIPSNLASIVSYFDSQEMNPNQDSGSYGQRSKNSYILNEPPCLPLSKYILKECQKYGKEVLGYLYTEYTFSQSWISIKSPGQFHTPHTHPLSLISGVLYYGGNFEEKSSAICFHNEYYGTHPLRPKLDFSNLTDSSPHTVYLQPKPGMLILFPSTLPHSVPINETNKSRKSLAFNIVPKEGFGSEEDLTELKFN